MEIPASHIVSGVFCIRFLSNKQNIYELIHTTINLLFGIHMAAGAIFVLPNESVHTAWCVDGYVNTWDIRQTQA